MWYIVNKVTGSRIRHPDRTERTGGGEGGSTDAGILLFYRISSSLRDGTMSDNSPHVG
jgi:hypothetical protein